MSHKFSFQHKSCVTYTLHFSVSAHADGLGSTQTYVGANAKFLKNGVDAYTLF